MNTCYITINENNSIVNGFSDAFKKPTENDIEISKTENRHFELLGVINPDLQKDGVFIYKFENGVVSKLSDAEIEIYTKKPLVYVTEDQKAIDMMKHLMQSDEFLIATGIQPRTVI